MIRTLWKTIPYALAIGGMAASLILTVPVIARERVETARRVHPDDCNTGKPCDIARNCSDTKCDGCDSMNFCKPPSQ